MAPGGTEQFGCTSPQAPPEEPEGGPPLSVPVGDTVRVTQQTAPLPAGAANAFTGAAATARFVTGEAVSLDLPVARLGSRMLARIVDILVQAVLFTLLQTLAVMFLGFLGMAGIVAVDGALFRAVMIVVLVAVVVGYPVTMETMMGGRTLGKQVLGLRVVRDDGGPIRFRQAITRGLISAAIEFPGLLAPPLTWLACLWTMSISRQGKRLGDFAAGTMVVHDRTPRIWSWVVPMPPPLARWATTLDLTGLDDELALAVRQYLARYRQLREPARSHLGRRLTAEVAAVTRPPAPPGTPYVAYLAAVHAERHQRTLRRLAAARARSAALWPDQAWLRPVPPSAPYPAVRPGAPQQPPGWWRVRTRG